MKNTERENQVIELLLQGCENEDIARELRLSPRTIKAILNRLYTRYGVSDSRYIKRVRLAVKLYREQKKSASAKAGGV